ncbi:hypothetical protein CMQ_539 [Grosmannia clavigera kw1407]|uniref:Uncharacterized protein n=1 Tax=Grosmannia clavigera (strain kw1407 / UAMH 11150) TaxID=655863 RepID=F0XEA8_GROCL|nr:uncharacterized protein CMQ_539 [Grosmannia clavigera kw1407]EFX03611.1 hypothetical protein CMQ_539 [Grosmannia clavigera kw1407]
MTGLMGDILECVAKEYREWRNGGQQPKWFPAKRSLQKVSELEGNGDLVKAFEEFQDGQKKWKNHPSVIEAFVSGRATRLFLALVYSNTLPLIDQFCTHGIGDKLFASLNPK